MVNDKVKAQLTKAVFDKIGGSPVITQEGDKLVNRGRANYHMVAEKTAAGGVSYESESKWIQFKNIQLLWDDSTPLVLPVVGLPLLSSSDVVQPVTDNIGILLEGRPGHSMAGIQHPNAFGDGLDLGVICHNLKMKVVPAIRRMPKFPVGATTIDVWEELSGDLELDWDHKTAFEITKPVKLGENSWLNPAYAWDSQWESQPDDEDGNAVDTLQNRIPIKSFLIADGGRYYHKKSTPVEWLQDKGTQYPVFCDADITWGATDELSSDEARFTRVCRIAGSTTKFGVSFCDGGGNGDPLVAIIGEHDGSNGIDWGAESQYEAAGHHRGHHDICSPTTDVILCVFTNAGDDDGWARAADLSGTTINGWGTVVEFSQNDDCEYPRCCVLDIDEAMAVYDNETNGDDLWAAHFTLSGTPKTTITVDVNEEIVATHYTNLDVEQIDTNKAAFAGGLGADADAIAISWDGSNFDQGAAVQFGTPLSYSCSIASTFPEFGVADQFIVVFNYKGGVDNIRATAFTCATLVLTAGSETHVTPADEDTGSTPGSAMLSETEFAVAYNDETDSGKMFSRFCSVNWGTRVITVGNAEEIDAANCSNIGLSFLTAGDLVAVYQNDDGTSGQARIGTYAVAGGSAGAAQASNASKLLSAGVL